VDKIKDGTWEHHTNTDVRAVLDKQGKYRFNPREAKDLGIKRENV
jgi:hypothetical protein